LNIVAKNEHNLSPMKVFLNRCWLGLCMGGMMATGMGCASHSTEMARQLDKTNPEYRSAGCQQTLGEVWVHQDIKNVTVFALPLLIAHVGLGAADRVDAATLAKRCGAPAPGVVDITTGVATDAALGVLGASAGAAVGKTLPAGAAAPLPAR
jgi:hypothetical protein